MRPWHLREPPVGSLSPCHCPPQEFSAPPHQGSPYRRGVEGEEESPRPTVSGVSFRRYRGHLRSGGSQKAKTETRGTGLGLRRGSKTKVRAVRPHSTSRPGKTVGWGCGGLSEAGHDGSQLLSGQAGEPEGTATRPRGLG